MIEELKTILDRISTENEHLSITTQDHITYVSGEVGSGKTTALIKIAAGLVGDLQKKKPRIGFFTHEMRAPEVVQMILDAHGNATIEKLLTRISFASPQTLTMAKTIMHSFAALDVILIDTGWQAMIRDSDTKRQVLMEITEEMKTIGQKHGTSFVLANQLHNTAKGIL